MKNNKKKNNQINQINDKHQINDIKNQNNNNILNISNGQNNVETKNKIKRSSIDNLNINTALSKAQKQSEIDIQTSPQNKSQRIIKDTSSKISPEELMFKTSHDIDFIEQKRSEEFKKAVEDWRKNKIT